MKVVFSVFSKQNFYCKLFFIFVLYIAKVFKTNKQLITYSSIVIKLLKKLENSLYKRIRIKTNLCN